MSGWGWLVMTVMLLAFVALVVVAIVVVGWLLGPPAEPPAGDQPPGQRISVSGVIMKQDQRFGAVRG